jgi:hypothetical protein
VPSCAGARPARPESVVDRLDTLRRSACTLLLAVPALAVAGVQLSAASFTSSSTNPGNSLSAKADWSPPAAGASVIGKTAGGSGGSIKQGATYYVYASVTDAGNPPAGTASATADVGSITTGQTAAALAAGSYAVDGTAYNYRSAALTANATLTAGSYSYALSLTDGAGNGAARTGLTVAVDNTAPSATDVQTVNATGGTAGKPELGDQLILTFSEPMDPTSILAGWSGAATNVVVRITDGGSGNDVLTVRNAANTAQLPLGSISLGRKDFVSATRDFGAGGTASKVTQSGGTITLTLGTPSGTTGTTAGTGSMGWTPSASATDRAGNPSSTTAKTESGAAADLDF